MSKRQILTLSPIYQLLRAGSATASSSVAKAAAQSWAKAAPHQYVLSHRGHSGSPRLGECYAVRDAGGSWPSSGRATNADQQHRLSTKYECASSRHSFSFLYLPPRPIQPQISFRLSRFGSSAAFAQPRSTGAARLTAQCRGGRRHRRLLYYYLGRGWTLGWLSTEEQEQEHRAREASRTNDPVPVELQSCMCDTTTASVK